MFSFVSAVEIIQHTPLKTIWLKAAVVGSLWASVEIILGSFLHNLNLPLSGTALSFISVYLLVAFFQVWKENGLIWRAGLICALMKSISPSAIILGPMIGIFTEALLLELFIFLIGKNLAGYAIGGAFAVFSTIIHKVVNLLITYGFNLITIFGSLYHFCMKQLHMESLRPRYLVLMISCIYLAAGIVAAFLGYRTGRRYLSRNEKPSGEQKLVFETGSQLSSPKLRHDYSLPFLLLNVVIVVLCLVLLNSDYIIPAVCIAIAYIVFCICRYRSSLRRLMRAAIWIQFLIIMVIAAFLWSKAPEDGFFSMDGLVAGLRMNFRAVLVILGFSAISIELKNPVIKSLLYRRGFSSLYQSLGLAFSALPGILSSLPKPEKGSGKWRFPVSGLFRIAEAMLTLFTKEHLTRPDVVIITGEIREGKTTYASTLIQMLQERGVAADGFLAPGIDKDGERQGFELREIKTGQRFPLCSTTPDASRHREGFYYFDPEGIREGNRILDSVDTTSTQILVIDEIGRMELRNQGWGASIERLTRYSRPLHLWIVRHELVKVVSGKWNVGTVFIVDIQKNSVSDTARYIRNILSGKNVSPE
jgi:nucleoside-triphosphatase THEP1